MKKIVVCLSIIVAASLLLFGCENTEEYVYDPDNYDREALCKYLTSRLSNRSYTYASQATDPEQKRMIELYNANGCDK